MGRPLITSAKRGRERCKIKVYRLRGFYTVDQSQMGRWGRSQICECYKWKPHKKERTPAVGLISSPDHRPFPESPLSRERESVLTGDSWGHKRRILALSIHKDYL